MPRAAGGWSFVIASPWIASLECARADVDCRKALAINYRVAIRTRRVAVVVWFVSNGLARAIADKALRAVS